VWRYLLLCVSCIYVAFMSCEHVRSGAEDKHFLPTDKVLTPLNSAEGRRLLLESKAQEAFWNLSQFYAPQPDLGSCSVASCTMVLNALPIERPVSKQHQPYKLFTPDNFFTPEIETLLKTDKLTARQRVSASGITLGELAKVLSTHLVKVECVYASDSDINRFRTELRTSLGCTDRHMIVNYLRGTLHQVAGGHISPLGAYNDRADKVLILDTANYKYPWIWVKTSDLWKAMAETIDDDSQRSRGYAIVSVRSDK
jgi:glutathione-S-conjugate glycine hydrolase